MSKKKVEEEQLQLPESLGGLQELCERLWVQVVEETDSKKQKRLTDEYNIVAEAYNTAAGEVRMTIITPSTLLSNVMPEDEPRLIGADDKPSKQAKKLADKINSKRDVKVGDLIKICFAGSKIDVKVEVVTEWDTFKVKGGDGVKYHVKREDIMQPGDTAREHLAKQQPQKKQTAAEPKERKPRANNKAGDVPPPSIANRPLEKMKRTAKIDAILKQPVAGAVLIREVFDLDPKTFSVQDFETMSGINKSRIIGCLKKYDKAKNFKF